MSLRITVALVAALVSTSLAAHAQAAEETAAAAEETTEAAEETTAAAEETTEAPTEPAPESQPIEPQTAPSEAPIAPADPNVLAREQGLLGLAAFSEGDFRTALARFGEAEELAHSPVFQLYMAKSLIGLAQDDEAYALLSEIAIHPAGDEPEAFRRAREAARTLLAEADEDQQAPVAPKAASPKESANAKPPPPSKEGSSGPSPLVWGAIGSFTVGGGGLIVGIIAGAEALSISSSIKDNCDGTSCLPEDQQRASDAASAGNLATAGFILAGVGAAVGVTLLVLDHKSEAGSARTLSLQARGPSLLLSGRF